MKMRHVAIVFLLFVLLAIAGCAGRGSAAPSGSATGAALAPTATSPPPTFTAVPTTATPLPATETPADTPLPPTAVPLSTAVVVATAEPTADLMTRPGNFSRQALMEDARQLAAIIENTHVDPYIRGGGKVAFHLRLDKLLHAISEEGMSKDEFIRLLRPFLAAIGDSHTELWSEYEVDPAYPGGVPVRFGIVEQSLYVAGVLDSSDEHLIGAVLTAVEGVPVPELLARQRELVPLENDYHVLEEMASHTLWYGPYLRDALPEWGDGDRITATFRLPGGEPEEVTFELPVSAARTTWPGTAIDLPPAASHGFYTRMMVVPTTGEEIAYLRVDHMEGFREAFEAMGEERPDLPSATELLREMVIEMADAGTETLIVDLRVNGGGSSLMGDILIYFLYGKEALTSIQYTLMEAGGQVNRYSAQCFTPPNNIGRTLGEINAGRSVPIELGEYDFTDFFAGDPEAFEAFVAGRGEPPSMRWYRATETFFSEYEAGTYAGYYRPENVVVLMSPWTFSSGFSMARDLYLAGATLVGTPSAQSSNSFSNGLLWRLDNTRLEGQVTRSYSQFFPPDSGLGEVLPVQHPLTYETLASYGFDPNAAFLYALEVVR